MEITDNKPIDEVLDFESTEECVSYRKISVKQLADAMALENVVPGIRLDNKYISLASINRPEFQLAGYFEYFDKNRIQITGLAEKEYMSTLTPEVRAERYDKLFALGFPAIICTRGINPSHEAIAAAKKYDIPILKSRGVTGKVIVDVVGWLNEKLAPMVTRHGVLVDVFGEGILITGDTGIGKSETAIELIKRGHRLVADDLVEITRNGDYTLVGVAPELTRHFVELRGIGVVDIKSLYGVECVKEQQHIDMIIHLEPWNGDTSYDRLGLDEKYEKILGIGIVRHDVPVRPGRNLAVVIETAAVNNRQKKMGYNAAQELVNKVNREILSKNME